MKIDVVLTFNNAYIRKFNVVALLKPHFMKKKLHGVDARTLNLEVGGSIPVHIRILISFTFFLFKCRELK